MLRSNLARGKCGVTLVELVVVLAIMAALSAVVVPIGFSIANNAEKEGCRATRSALYTSWTMGKKLAGSEVTLQETVKTFNSTGLVFKEALGGCPKGGAFSVGGNGRVVCGIHGG